MINYNLTLKCSKVLIKLNFNYQKNPKQTTKNSHIYTGKVDNSCLLLLGYRRRNTGERMFDLRNYCARSKSPTGCLVKWKPTAPHFRVFA